MKKNRRSLHAQPRITRRDFLRLSALLGAGTASGLLAACGGPGAPPALEEPTSTPELSSTPAGPQGTLNIVQGVDAESMDPQVTTSGASMGMMRAMFDRLTDRALDMSLVPALAHSWELLDNRTWQFNLVEGVNFHNGEPFTAEAVKFSIERFVDPELKHVYASTMEPISEIEIVDDYTVKIHTKEPYAILAEVFARHSYMLPPKATAELGEDFGTSPIGTGPYKFVEWLPGERLTIEAADDHWNRPPKLAEVIWRPIGEAATRLVELQSGNADIITNLAPQQIETVEQEEDIHVVQKRGLSSHFIWLNCGQPPTDDPRVRKALTLAVDVQSIIDNVLMGAAYRLAGPWGPGIPGYVEDTAPYPYDPEQAKQLLAEAGYADGFDITLVSPQGRYLMDKEASEAIVTMWSEIGVNGTVEVKEWGSFVQGVIAKDKPFQAFFFRQGGPVVDDFARINFHSGVKGPAWQGYHNEEANKIIDEAIQTLDEAEREAMYQRLFEIVYDELPWLPLWNQTNIYGVQDRVKGWNPRADDVIVLGDTYVTAEA